MALCPQVSVVQNISKLISGDGLVAAWGPNHAFLVTSPNATYVPEIVEGIVTVYLRDNGAFGKHDPIQWPQLYVARHPYLAAIPKNTGAPCPESAIWNHPSQHDFIGLPNVPVHGFGHLSRPFLEPLEPLVAQMSTKCRQYVPPHPTIDAAPLRQYELVMSRAWQRLLHTSATFRDQMLQLSCLRRYWLLCSAFITFYDLFYRPPSADPLPVNEHLMGAWTPDPCVVQMFLPLGIPVWLVHAPHLVSPHIRVVRFVAIGSTDALCHVKFYGDEGHMYQGPVGERHLEVTFKSQFEHMCLSGSSHNPYRYRDISAMPTALVLDPNEDDSVSRGQRLPSPSPRGGPSFSNRRQNHKARYRPSPYNVAARDRSKSAHPSQVRGRDKFVEITHAWMPPSLPSWERAMRAVDRSDKARPGRWGYWIPEPGLLLSPKNPERLQRYLMNWLSARPVWLYVLQLPGSETVRLPPQHWRDFLHGVPDDPKSHTRSGKRAYEIKRIFGQIFSEQELNPSASGEAVWHHRRVDAVDDHIGPLLIWETFELGFRYELCELDRAMHPTGSAAEEVERAALLGRVFPSDSLFTVLQLPSPETHGLFAPLPHRRILSLNALREILSPWPLCPPEIRNGRPLQTSDSEGAIQEFELRIACFYTQTFFDVAGRAPIVPHRYPFAQAPA